MKLYTKTGDDGSTGLIGGHRVQKHDPRVAAYGDVDETNAAIGLALSACDDTDNVSALRQIQSDMFNLGAELATPSGNTPQHVVSDDDVRQLEKWIDMAAAAAPALKNFVLPGGCEFSARLHFARTVCRRAERTAAQLAGTQTVRPTALTYLNRLSDLLFALARAANARSGTGDIPWIPTKS